MDRLINFDGAIPLSTDPENVEKNAYIGLSKLAAAILGASNILVNNASCVSTSPASMQLTCGACEIYSLQNIDNSDYGDIPSDTTHQILKQGVNLSQTTLTLTAPGTAGQSVNYLIEFGFAEVDGNPVVLNYYNASNPSSPYNGPGNTGDSNNTTRYDQVSIVAKGGSPATSGSQVTPSPDSGYIGAFVVTVANGQTTITSGNISNYLTTNPNLINETLIQKISQATADARYAQITGVQNGQFIYANDIGAANAYVCSLSPALTSYVAGLGIRLKIANNNTGASTLAINGLAAIPITFTSLSALTSGQISAGMIAELIYDGTEFQLMNPASSTSTVTSGQVQENSFTYFADISGSANTIKTGVNAISPAIVSPSAGLVLYSKIANANTGATTLVVQQSPSSNVTFTVTNINGSALSNGQVIAGMIAEFFYDGTNLQLLNPAVSAGNSVTPYQLQTAYWTLCQDNTTTPNQYIVQIPNAGIGSLAANAIFSFSPTITNTGACTLQLYSGVTSLGTYNLWNSDFTPLVAGQIRGLNSPVFFTYSQGATAMLLLNPAPIQLILPKPIYLVDGPGSSGNSFVSELGLSAPIISSIQSWIPGLIMTYLVPRNNTSASTFDIYIDPSTLGAKSIKKVSGSALASGSMISGMMAQLVYDGTNVQLLNPQA
jgi:hypothetical protein